MTLPEKKTAILINGTFSPITSAHVALGEYLHNYNNEADIFYVPSNLVFMKYWKKIDSFFKSDDERIRMIKEAVSDFANVSTIEVDNTVTGTTYDTVNYFLKEYDSVFICMGTDKLTELSKWYKSEELFSNVKVYLFSRNGQHLKDCRDEFINRHIDNFIELTLPEKFSEMSSTKIRNAQNPKDVVDMIPEKVRDYYFQ